MGLLMLATLAEERGYEARFFDLQADDEVSVQSVLDFHPDVIAISATSPSHRAAIRLAEDFKRAIPSVPIVKGGVHETYCAQHTLNTFPCIDYSMVGEVDSAFVSLLDALSGNGAVETVPGLVYRDTAGEARIGPPARPVGGIDDLPVVNRALLGEPGPYNFRIFGYAPTTQVQTMRGCPFMCSFCNQRNRRVLYRSIDGVVDELVHLKSLGYAAVFFDDATFTVNRSRTLELVRAVTDRGVGLRFAAQTRAELVDAELLEQMAQGGFEFLSFGLETSDPVALTQMLKVRTPGKHHDASAMAVSLCRESGIKSCLNLIVGWPGESRESLMRTFRLAAELNPDYVSMSAYAKYPHEDAGLADLYSRGVSTEAIWEKFDEGWGSYHPGMSANEAETAYELGRQTLGSCLDVT